MSEARVILGDCLEVLPTLDAGAATIVATDPPYRVKDKVRINGTGVAPVRQESTTIGDQGWTLSKEWLTEAARICSGHIIAFGNYLDLPELLQDWGQGELRGIFTWRKSNAALPAWNVPRYDTEFAVWFGRGKNPANIKQLTSMVLDCPFPPAGCFAGERIVDETGKAVHPAQKPLKVMKHLLKAFTEPGDTALDPFMGTGTTLVAALECGCNVIGIEKDPDYFAIARRRIIEAQHATPLFAAAAED